MSNASTSENAKVHRVRTDPVFYALFGVIGGTYVVLILAMLLADATYVFTADMSEQVTMDFSIDGDGKQLAVGDALARRFDKYGLRIKTHDDAAHPARIVDSDKPSAANSNLGTPNQDFAGPGVGSGGGSDKPGSNAMPLGNVLVIAENAGPATAVGQHGEFVVSWVEPVHVESLHLHGFSGSGGRIVTYDAGGKILSARQLDRPGGGETLVVKIGEDAVSRMDVTLLGGVAEAVVSYALTGKMQIPLDKTGRNTVKLGHFRVAPPQAQQIAPLEEPGKVIFQWEDPVQVDKLLLLDIDQAGGSIVSYDIRGEALGRRTIKNLGANSVQTAELGDRDVARLELNLPGGGAVGELSFTWLGRVRSPWERDRPGLAKLLHNPVTAALGKPEIQYSIKLSMLACTITAILSLWVAVPIGYLMSRHEFFGRNVIDAILDIPVVLPPLVVGLSLLILFQFLPTTVREAVVYEIPAVILAQFAVACAFAVRTMRATFDQIDARREQVALTLGCSRAQAFGMVVLPEAKRGVLTAGTLAWARALGEFGPLLIFAGTTRMKTEVLSVSVFLEISIGSLGAAVAVSLIMVIAAVLVLVLARTWGTRSLTI